MKTLGLRLFRKKHVQTSALTALTASASVPGSGFAFMANSQGASGALVEFTKAVSAALDFIDLEGRTTNFTLFYQVRLTVRQMTPRMDLSRHN